jgi:glutaminyl-peptide cyclotransferase
LQRIKTGWIAVLLLAALVAVVFVLWKPKGVWQPQTATDPLTQTASKSWTPPAPLQSARAMKYLEQLCAIGSRTTGTPGMVQQQQLLQAHFEKLGGKVVWQSFQHRHPQTGQPVEVKNLIVQWHPDRMERVVLCSHYDTRPFPDRDPKNRTGLFVGANDGASSTAALMELGHAMADKSIKIGVDFVLFDAEELVFGEQKGDYFIGSTYFAQQYVADPPPYRYRSGILMDMIGDKDLQLYYDKASFTYAPQLAREVWDIARGLGLKEFSPRVVHDIRDDHLPMNEIARIPTIDIIDFDYPTAASRTRSYWHTMADTPDKCSGDSLTKVLAVILEWLKRQQP